MEFGVHVIAFVEPDHPDGPIARFTELVREADRLGIDRVTTGGHAFGSRIECVIAQTVMALETRQIHIGPMVANPKSRDVGTAAAEVASLDALTGGRAFFVLGRGDGDVHSVGFASATMRELRDYLTAMRELLLEGGTLYQGRQLTLTWPSSLARVPLYVVAEGPRMLGLAGGIGDGVYVGSGLLPDVVEDAIDRVRAGARTAGRDPDAIDIWWNARCAVAPTHEEAVQLVRRALASAGNHALHGDYEAKLVPSGIVEPLRRFHERYDYGTHGSRLQGQGEARASNANLMDELGLTDYFLERFGIVGTPDELVERLVALNDRGVEKVNLHAWDLAGLRLLGEQVFPRVNEALERRNAPA